MILLSKYLFIEVVGGLVEGGRDADLLNLSLTSRLPLLRPFIVFKITLDSNYILLYFIWF